MKSNASAHLRRRFVLNIDVKDFFSTITERRVYGLLRSLGVEDRVSQIVARICCVDGRLPQGAPTSPTLSNMICFRLDKALFALAKNTRSIYTRYADDITFSGNQPLIGLFDKALPKSGRVPLEALSTNLTAVFLENGFELNSEKSHYADRSSRRMVTGLKINELLNVDRRFIRNIRATLYSIEKFGIAAAQITFEIKHGGKCDLALHLKGEITWLLHIRGQADPVFRAVALRFNNCLPEHKLVVNPTFDEIRDRAVWIVEHFDGDMAQGTAFFLKDVGLVTAAHNVEGSSNIDVYHPSKTSNKFKVKVKHFDIDRDLAILEHEIAITEYFEIVQSASAIIVGEQTIAAGYPSYGPGDKLNIRIGTVSSLPVKSAVRKIEVTQNLAQGMSGGPLFDSKGTVTGVIHKGGPEEARESAINILELCAWIKTF